jgi:hypothetical protein
MAKKSRKKPGKDWQPVDPALESFGPVSSLEPDGVEEGVPEGAAGDPIKDLADAAPHAQEIRATEGRAGPKDWSAAGRLGEPPGELSEEEVEADRILLDDGFLKRTFKELHFPARKEMCLRYVDQEQDFAYGLDRTVNLHTLITHLEPEEFATRTDLIKAIKDQLHHHA